MSHPINTIINENILEIAEEAGLIFSGRNADGEPEFIGSDRQWTKYEFLKLKNNL